MVSPRMCPMRTMTRSRDGTMITRWPPAPAPPRRVERLRDPLRGLPGRRRDQRHADVEYTEPDASIPQRGRIALQVHGGGKVEVWYRQVRVRSLR